MKIVTLDCSKITNEKTFHKVFKDIMGFPDFYGNNMNAWVDCMTALDAPEDGMTKVTVGKGEMLTLQLENIKEFSEQCPEQYDALIESSAFVNWRRIEKGDEPILAISFYKN